jgi:cytochrome c oxidase subunit 2
MSMTLQTLTHLATGAHAAGAFAQAASGPVPANFWQPVAASTNAAAIDQMWDLINWICYVFFALVVLLMVVFVVKYRHRAGTPFRTDYPHHNTPLELTWSILPTILVIGIFWFGFKGYLDITTAPKNAFEVKVTAQKWAWNFQYPNGAQSDDL